MIKDSKTGAVAEEFEKFREQKDHQLHEISHLFNEAFVVKSKEELENIKKSSMVTTYFLSKFIKEI